MSQMTIGKLAKATGVGVETIRKRTKSTVGLQLTRREMPTLAVH
jgi:hypothetical protein